VKKVAAIVTLVARKNRPTLLAIVFDIFPKDLQGADSLGHWILRAYQKDEVLADRAERRNNSNKIASLADHCSSNAAEHFWLTKAHEREEKIWQPGKRL
jgi:hypothetical protein